MYKRETIDPEIFKKDYSEAQLKYLRKNLGTNIQVSCEMEFTQDFKEYPDYTHFNFISMVNMAFDKSGVLPFPGSFVDQPAQIIEIIEVMFQLEAEREQDARRKAEKDSKKK